MDSLYTIYILVDTQLTFLLNRGTFSEKIKKYGYIVLLIAFLISIIYFGVDFLYPIKKMSIENPTIVFVRTVLLFNGLKVVISKIKNKKVNLGILFILITILTLPANITYLYFQFIQPFRILVLLSIGSLIIGNMDFFKKNNKKILIYSLTYYLLLNLVYGLIGMESNLAFTDYEYLLNDWSLFYVILLLMIPIPVGYLLVKFSKLVLKTKDNSFSSGILSLPIGIIYFALCLVAVLPSALVYYDIPNDYLDEQFTNYDERTLSYGKQYGEAYIGDIDGEVHLIVETYFTEDFIVRWCYDENDDKCEVNVIKLDNGLFLLNVEGVDSLYLRLYDEIGAETKVFIDGDDITSYKERHQILQN